MIICFFGPSSADAGSSQKIVKVDDKPARLKQFTTTITDLKIQIPISKFENPITQTFW